MGNFRQGRPYKGLSVVFGEHMLLNINLVVCRNKLIILDFFLRLVGRNFFKLNPRIRILKKYLSKVRLLTSKSLGVLY